MQLRDLLRKVTYGPMGKLSMSDEWETGIRESDLRKTVSYINTALTKLYGRFCLVERELLVKTLPGKTIYLLDAKHALSDPRSEQKFIIDSALDPFTDDVIKILSVYDDAGYPIAVNDRGTLLGVNLIGHKTIQIGDPSLLGGVIIIYQGKHKTLSHDDLLAEVTLPDVLLEALEAYVGYQAFFAIPGQENAQTAASLLAKYETSCAEISIEDLVSTSRLDDFGNRFTARGFT